MHLGQAQCDWVSFLVECEPDLFQTHYLEEWNMLVVARLPAHAQAKQQRVHALGATTGGRRRYVLSLWGESAQQVKHLPFEKWVDHITRYDVKRKVYDCRPDTYQRLCVALQFAETRRNVEAFKLPKRTKNDKRDSGGEGVRFGSRKSDVSTKLSRRGNEIPYFETQIQDDTLDAGVLNILTDLEGGHPFREGWACILDWADQLQRKHIDAWLFAAGIDRTFDGLTHDDIPMPMKLQELFQLDIWAGGAPLPEPTEEPERRDPAPV